MEIKEAAGWAYCATPPPRPSLGAGKVGCVLLPPGQLPAAPQGLCQTPEAACSTSCSAQPGKHCALRCCGLGAGLSDQAGLGQQAARQPKDPQCLTPLRPLAAHAAARERGRSDAILEALTAVLARAGPAVPAATLLGQLDAAAAGGAAGSWEGGGPAAAEAAAPDQVSLRGGRLGGPVARAAAAVQLCARLAHPWTFLARW
jgi:hypothetical protein